MLAEVQQLVTELGAGGPWPLPGPISLKVLKIYLIYLIFKFVIFFFLF
jgi:hypothetical protein